MKQCFTKYLQKFNQKPLAMIVWFISHFFSSHFHCPIVICAFAGICKWKFFIWNWSLVSKKTTTPRRVEYWAICVFWTEICVVFKLKYVVFFLSVFVLRLLKSKGKTKQNETSIVELRFGFFSTFGRRLTWKGPISQNASIERKWIYFLAFCFKFSH